jgi:hypothetical protein
LVQLPPPRPHPAGHRRPPSPLDSIQPDHWLPTSDLLDLLHVLGRLIELEPAQADLLNRICDGLLRSANKLKADGALAVPEVVGAPMRKCNREMVRRFYNFMVKYFICSTNGRLKTDPKVPKNSLLFSVFSGNLGIVVGLWQAVLLGVPGCSSAGLQANPSQARRRYDRAGLRLGATA